MKKLKPAGYLAIAVGLVFVVGAVGLLGRYIWSATRTLDDLGAVAYTPPPQTPTSTSVPVPPTREPLPEGWSIERDPFTGDDYLAPSPEVEMAVREAFKAVLSLGMIEDRPNEEASTYDLDAALARAEELATAEVVDGLAERLTPQIVFLVHLGPENPVQCQDYGVCEVVIAKLGVVGAIVYDEGMCNDVDSGIPAEYEGPEGIFLLAGDGTYCVTRMMEVTHPYEVFFGTVTRQDDDRWIVTHLEWEPIPKPSGS